MIQELKPGYDASIQMEKLPIFDRKDRNLIPQKPIAQTLKLYHICKRKDAKFSTHTDFTLPIANTTACTCALQKYKLWLLPRFFGGFLESQI